ncbi:alpha/beta fold hydrolase [Streptomyces globisporus]|uniref:alpha/beta hydrolase family protein n=1 Tax=Streptomyces globisporus TaxID=1908 RepID=UPI00131C8ACB|nr:alpha/beta fold hydrolase [Streptomyces globisporus]
MRTSPFPVLAELTAPDGAALVVRVHARVEPTAPVVVVLPAMGTAARHYTPLVRALHRRGATVVTTDLRGHGESTPVPARGIRFGYRELVEHDIGAVLDAVERAFPRAPRLLLGHSLGGQLGLVHCGLLRPRLAGVVLVASGSAWWRALGTGAVPRPGARWLVRSLLCVAGAELLGYWPGDRFGFGGRESVGVMRDWARQMRTGRYEAGGSAADYEAALGRVDLPVLAVDVEGDALAPPRAVDHLCAKLTSARVRRWSYRTSDAGGRRLDHFRWIRHNAGLVERIAAWAEFPAPPASGADTGMAGTGGRRGTTSTGTSRPGTTSTGASGAGVVPAGAGGVGATSAGTSGAGAAPAGASGVGAVPPVTVADRGSTRSGARA